MVDLDEVDLNHINSALHLYVDHIMCSEELEQHEKRDFLRTLFTLQEKVEAALAETGE